MMRASMIVTAGLIGILAGLDLTARQAAVYGAAAAGDLGEYGLTRVDDYGLPLVAYATVERAGGSYRRMLTRPETLEVASSGMPLPEGTRIFMETYYSPGTVGTVFHKMKVGEHWQYGSFSAARPDLAVRPQASCLSCHAGAAETDYTYTYPSLLSASEGAGESRLYCDRGGRTPCDLSIYLEGAAR